MKSYHFDSGINTLTTVLLTSVQIGVILSKANDMQKKYQAGFTILEALIALIVMVAILSTGAVYMRYNADNNLNRSAAEQLHQLTAAVQSYAKDNLTILKEGAGDTDVKLKELIDQGYLSNTFSDKNSYSQGYNITISAENNTSDDKANLKLLVITQGGDMINVGNLRKIAALAGNESGYALQSGTITGNQEGWTIDDSAIETGHLASLSYVSSADIVSAETFLRRSKFAGHPEWNQMNTDLLMLDNSITMEKDNASGVLNHDGLILKDKQQSTLTSDALSFTSSTASEPTAVTGDYEKPATYILDVSPENDREIYRQVDNICGDSSQSSIGKIFFAGVNKSGKAYVAKFICGVDDGYKVGSGRAYLNERFGVPPVDMGCKYLWTTRHGCNVPLTSDGRYYDSLRSVFNSTDFEGQGWYYNDKDNSDGMCKNNGLPHRSAIVCAVERKQRLLSKFIIPDNSTQENVVGIPGQIENDAQCNAFGYRQNLREASQVNIIRFIHRFPPYTEASDRQKTNTFDTCRRIKVQGWGNNPLDQTAPFVNKETD